MGDEEMSSMSSYWKARTVLYSTPVAIWENQAEQRDSQGSAHSVQSLAPNRHMTTTTLSHEAEVPGSSLVPGTYA